MTKSEDGQPSKVQVPQTVLRSPTSLRPNQRNARTHSKKQIQQIAASIRTTGFIGAVIIENDVVLAGAARLKACEQLGLAEPTMKVVDLSEAQKRTFALADNKIAENAGWNREVLMQELDELQLLLQPLNLDLSVTGFEAAEIDALFADLQDSQSDPADLMPEVKETPVTRRGDFWCLGPHRLICGDARSQNVIDRLMIGSAASMAFLDVPYNVRVADVQGRGSIKHGEFAFASGEMGKSEYVAFLRDALANAARVSEDGALHYVCNDWRHIVEMITAGEAIYGEMMNLAVWAKTNAGQGSFYRSQHELIGVFQVGRGPHRNNVQLGRFGRNRSNLWTYAGINGFGSKRMEYLGMHPTVKPVALIADAMRDCTAKGAIVLDTFAGSGSTLMAAEKVGRSGYCIEFEPRYVDVAIRRWEAQTKADAVLLGDGRTFTEIKAERVASSGRTNSTALCNTPDRLDSSHAAADDDDGPSWVSLCQEVPLLPPTESIS
jgi:DNA modification methylase